MVQIFQSIQDDLNKIKSILSQDIPKSSGSLSEVVEYVLLHSGKLLRPSLVLAVGRALSLDLQGKHYYVALATELMHIASLLHDDVIDEAESRRGRQSVHSRWSNKFAILGGDYLFAQSSYYLSKVDNSRISSIYAELLMSLCQGEMQQAQGQYQKPTWEQYINKSRAKTAIMFSSATQASAIVSGSDEEVIQSMYDYADNLGIAFQIVDDLLDFTSSEEQLGKPRMGDLSNGIFTAPILYACEDGIIQGILEDNLPGEGDNKIDLNYIYDILDSSKSFVKTYDLAVSYANKAREALSVLSDSPYRRDLELMVDFVLERKY